MCPSPSTLASRAARGSLPDSPEESRRGPQAEKSAGTRSRILDATINCLIELGYSRTTTVEVSDRAGVSRGAMLHHYPSKAELLYAAMDDLHQRRMEALMIEVAKFGDADDVVEVAVNLFWELTKHPYYYAIQELTNAARTERELRQTLLPLARRFEDELFRVTGELFSDYVKPGTPFEEMRDIARFFFDGLAMGRVLHQDDAFADRSLDFFKQLLRDLLVEPQSIQVSPTLNSPEVNRPALIAGEGTEIDDETRTPEKA